MKAAVQWLPFVLVLVLFVSWPAARTEEANADEEFRAWLDALRRDAMSRKISTDTIDVALRDAQVLERVVELDQKQPEFNLTFDQYLDRVINDRRVQTGRDKLWEHRALLADIQEQYGVQPRFVVALWGIESDFGRRTGGFSVIDALVSLSYNGRREKFFRGELLDALQILDERHIARESMLGSWAGAMGQPQFMPSSFLRFAVDHDGDSRRDIWNSTADVLASAANYLASSGWRGDLIWGRPVRLPDGFDTKQIGRKNRKPLAQWQEMGVRRLDGSDLPRAEVKGAIVRPDADGGEVFMVYDNYGVLLKWNRSDYFATAVGILSDRISQRSGG